MAAKLASIINMKGGVGKTTLSFNLAMYLAEMREKKVLLIDLDPQANATIVSTKWEDYEKHLKTKRTIADIFIHSYRAYGPVKQKEKPPLKLDEFTFEVYKSGVGGGVFHLIPSELMLSSVLKGMTLGPFDLDALINESVTNEYEYIFIDCAPTYSSLTTIALNTTKAVLIPMIADSFGVYGTELMKRVLSEHKYDYGISPKVIGVIFTMWKEQRNQITHSNKIIKGWKTDQVFRTRISQNEWYKVANGKRINIWNTPTMSKYKKEFVNFVDEFIAKA